MGYVADFVTGRSIAEGDKAVGIVIVPNVRGWPDPVQAAATDPTHPHERFSPISLPLKGFINDRGYFEPEKKQLALSLLLDMVGFESWKAFFDKGFDFREKEPGFMFDGRRALAGISAMHVGTFDALLDMGTYEGIRDGRAADAARIIIDAQKRFKLHKDDQSYFLSIFNSGPREDLYTTLDGETMSVPDCSRALEDGHIWQVDRAVRRHIAKRYGDAHLGDGKELTQIFDLLSGFQKLCRGLNYTGNYFKPGGFIRHDNLYDVANLQLGSLKSTFENSGARRRTGFEWADEAFIGDMEAVAEQIRQLHAVVEEEISKARAYFADDQPEADDDETPVNSIP
jgi:hypothetical protein